METRTTAQLREQAAQAEDRGNYLTASELYQLAVTRYPVAVDNSQLARADIDLLRTCARRCLDAHKQRTAIPAPGDPMVTTIRGALDQRSRTAFEAEYDKSVRVTEHALPERAS